MYRRNTHAINFEVTYTIFWVNNYWSGLSVLLDLLLSFENVNMHSEL